jgi:hypothetical protein
MAVDGTYAIELTTPHGKQSGRLTLRTDGNSLSGSYSGGLGEQSFNNGVVNADEVVWSLEVTGPMGNVKLDFRGTVSGDEISGQVQLGSSDSSDFKAIRA